MEPQLLTVVPKEALAKWPYEEWRKWQIEPKHDGFRLLVVGGVPQSRSGKPLHNIDHILETLKPYPNVVFDGELHGSTWEETSHVARASKSERDTKLTFTIFDCLTIVEWRQQFATAPLWQRQESLFAAKHLLENPYIKFVEPLRGHNYLDFTILNHYHLAAGCDGTVLKRIDSLYEFKRTKTWLKVKPALDCDCYVTTMEEGKGKYKGTLGALVVLPVRDKDGVTSGPTTKVSGMTDAQRHEWWENPNAIIGKVIEVTYRKMNPSGRMVEPRFNKILT